MCLILDANVRNLLSDRDSPVNAWLNAARGNPRLVAAGKLLQELANKDDVRRRLVGLDRAGLLRRPDAGRLTQEEGRLRRAGCCVSNDHHVLALAIVSGARTLATNDDSLMSDFRNKGIIDGPRGSIYRDPLAHRHLLRHTPKSCGIHPTSSRNSRIRS